MKNEFQQWLEVDIETIEEKPLNDIQKQKIKKSILSEKHSCKAPKKWLTVAISSVVILTTSYFTLPAIASQIPFIENIISFVDKDFVPTKFEELSTVIGGVQSSNGIDMMIENAVFDGTNLMITYAVKTEQDLGNWPMVSQMPTIKGSTGMSGTGSLEKLDDTTYVGVEKLTPHFDEEPPKELAITWNPTAFKNIDTKQVYNGNWSFDFNLQKLPNTTQQLNEKSSNDDGSITMTAITYSDLTAVLEYEFKINPEIMKEWPLSTIELIKVTDNFGNSHEINGNGGAVSEDGHGFDWSVSLYTLNEDVTSLTVTPEIYLTKGSGTQIERKEMDPITINLR